MMNQQNTALETPGLESASFREVSLDSSQTNDVRFVADLEKQGEEKPTHRNHSNALAVRSKVVSLSLLTVGMLILLAGIVGISVGGGQSEADHSTFCRGNVYRYPMNQFTVHPMGVPSVTFSNLTEAACITECADRGYHTGFFAPPNQGGDRCHCLSSDVDCIASWGKESFQDSVDGVVFTTACLELCEFDFCQANPWRPLEMLCWKFDFNSICLAAEQRRTTTRPCQH